MARTFEEMAQQMAAQREDPEFRAAARMAAARMAAAAQPSVSDAQGRTFAVEPDPLTRRAQEQDMLARRLDEADAVLQAKAARGEDVTRDLEEIGRLSSHAIAPLEAAPGIQHAPAPQMGLYRGGERGLATPLPPSLDMAGRSQQEREILHANERMVREAERLAAQHGPLGQGMRI